MESPVKACAINGSPQKTAKPRDKMPGVAEPSFASNRSDRAETIEDIISELNATARTEAPCPEAPGDPTLDNNGEPPRDSVELCDRYTESITSSPELIEDSDEEAVTTACDEEADIPYVDPEDRYNPEYVLPDPEYVLPDTHDARSVYERVPTVSEDKGADVSLPQTSERASQDSGETVEPAGDELSQLQTQKIPECTPDNDASATISEAEPDKSDEVPNDPGGGLERSDAGIKVPDETIQSPRRTSRQRVASQKLIESSQSLKTRHGSGTSDVSSVESSPVKQSGSSRLVTSDSDSDAPLARRVRKQSGNLRPVTSDSDSDAPLAQRKRKTSAGEGSDSTVVKRLSFVRKAKDTTQVKRTSPAKSVEAPHKKGSVTDALKQNGESQEDETEPLPELVPQDSENAATPKKAGSAKKKSTPTSANKSKRKSTQPEGPVSVDSTGIESSPHQDGDASSGAPKSKKAKGKASRAAVTPVDSPSQCGSELNELPKPKKAKGKTVKGVPTPVGSPTTEQPTAASKSKKGKTVLSPPPGSPTKEQPTAASKSKKGKTVLSPPPGSPTKDHNEVAAVPSPKKGKRKSDRALTSPKGQATLSTANEENEQPTTSKRRGIDTTSAAGEENDQQAAPKRQRREGVADGSDTGQVSSASPAQAANRVGGSSVPRRTEHISLQSPQATASQSVEPPPVLLWASPQFSASDRLLRETIQVGLRGRQPAAGPSYLTIEVPSANVRRTWGPAVAHRRPTVVLGGCDPHSMYVNLAGTRVPLQQWQHVSKITPTIRLTDIFKTFSPA